MAWTQSDIDTIKKAIAQGVTSVTYADGRSASFRSLAEMREILAMMTAEVSGKTTRCTYAKFQKG